MSKLVPTVYERERKVWKTQTQRRVPTTERTYKYGNQPLVKKTYDYDEEPLDKGVSYNYDKEKRDVSEIVKRNWNEAPPKMASIDRFLSPYENTYSYDMGQDPIDSGYSYSYDEEKRHQSDTLRRNVADTPSKFTQQDGGRPLYNTTYNYDIELDPLDSGLSYSYDSGKRRESEIMRRNWDDTFHKVAPRADDWKLNDVISKRILPVNDVKIGASNSDLMLTEKYGPKNPITEDRFGQRKFRLEYEMADYKPEEITVKLNGRFLTVRGKHEEKGGVKSSKREYSRQYFLPPEVKPELLTAKLGYTGKLTIEATVSPRGRDKDMIIPVRYGY